MRNGTPITQLLFAKAYRPSDHIPYMVMLNEYEKEKGFSFKHFSYWTNLEGCLSFLVDEISRNPMFQVVSKLNEDIHNK